MPFRDITYLYAYNVSPMHTHPSNIRAKTHKGHQKNTMKAPKLTQKKLTRIHIVYGTDNKNSSNDNG